ncbi:hypothetical protein AB7M50_005950 [Bradyrhizobium elkanii]
MRHAIDFNDQLAVKRNEINNVPVNRVLATKLPPRQSSVAQCLPKLRFGARL